MSSMYVFKKLICLGLLSLTSSLAYSQIQCQFKVFQNDAQINPTYQGSVQHYSLQASEFRLEVAPAACNPTIATIPTIEIAKQIAGKPLLYSDRWAYIIAANIEDRDNLVWMTRTSFDPIFLQSPDENTFEGRQYLRLCDELKFCPNVYPAFSSETPFSISETGSKSTAVFKRLNAERPFEIIKGKSVFSVIYTLWRSLPSEYPMADPKQLLFRPNFMSFDFLDIKAQTK